jgi:TFIIF-interacting CTD phosphatase-like protein
VERCDFKIDVEIEDIVHHVYVLVRPKAREFLEAVAEHYELGIFTASLAKVIHCTQNSMQTQY